METTTLLLYAGSAGALATFNPCAYTLLPAILSRFLARGQGGVRAGLKLGALLALGTLTAFAGVGSLLALVGMALGRAFPYVAVGLALLFLLLGALSVAGRKPSPAFGLRAPKGEGAGSSYLYGLGFGLASLGCTLPVFLSVAGMGLSAGAFMGATVLALYGLGMGAVLVCLGVATALGKRALLARGRGLGRAAEPLGGVLLIAAGGYLLLTNVGFLTFDYTLGWRLGAGAAGAALLAGLLLRAFSRHDEAVPV